MRRPRRGLSVPHRSLRLHRASQRLPNLPLRLCHPPKPLSRSPIQQSDVSLQSFDDVVALAEAKRDLKLRNALLEQVRLVHFKPGKIEVNPLPFGARAISPRS